MQLQRFLTKKTLVRAIVGFILLYVSYAGYQAYLNSHYATLYLIVAPSDSKVTIDEESKTRAPGTLRLSPGDHKITVAHDGFTSQSFSVKLAIGTPTKKQLSLSSNSPKGATYLQNNEADALKSEDIAGTQLTNGAASLADRYPILSRLPITGDGYSVNLGKSMKSPPSEFALWVNCPSTTTHPEPRVYCQDKINAWMQAQGFSPSDYEFYYKQ